MSNAKKTIESSIMTGLSKNAHITKASAQHSELQVGDIMNALFHPSTRWAVKAYLKELGDL